MLVFKLVVGFAITNVISAVFIQQTMRVAATDDDLIISAKKRSASTYARSLSRVFQELDKNDNGTLSQDEFCDCLKDPKVKYWLEALEINPTNATSLFNIPLMAMAKFPTLHSSMVRGGSKAPRRVSTSLR